MLNISNKLLDGLNSVQAKEYHSIKPIERNFQYHSPTIIIFYLGLQIGIEYNNKAPFFLRTPIVIMVIMDAFGGKEKFY